MRLMLLLSIVGMSGFVSFFQPFIGLLSFTWLAYFRPQNLAWGAQDLRLSVFVGIGLLIGCLLNFKQEKLFIKSRETILMIILLGLFGISTVFALDSGLALSKLTQMGKIIVIAVLTAGLLNSEKRFRYFAWLLAIIFGFLAVKGALRGIFLGWHLRGPAHSMIADNNEIALALNMVLPFFLYLGINEKIKWRKFLFYSVFIFTIIAIIYTFSRGGFVGLCVVILVLVLKSKRKMLGITLLLVGVLLAFAFVPQAYIERMESIKNYKQDINIMSRFYAWQAAWAMAKDRPLSGVGPRNFMLAFPNYHWYPEPAVAHNSYFHILAESGFIALSIFLLLLHLSISKLRYLRKVIPRKEPNIWVHNYSHMLEAGLIGYMVSGFFLSRADFDLLYQFIGMVIALGFITSNKNLAKKKVY